SNAYELHEVDLLDSRLTDNEEEEKVFWRTTIVVPNVWTYAVDKAATTGTAQAFLGFARFPAARAFVDPSRRATVRWTDMRVAGGLLTLDQPVTRSPFAVTIRLGPDGSVIEEL